MTTKPKKVFQARVIHNSKPAKDKGDGGSKKKNKREARSSEAISLVIDLPFAPAIGTMIRASPNGEFLRVTAVFWDIGNPSGLLVFTEEPEPELLHSFAAMQREGWQRVDPAELARFFRRNTAPSS